MSRPEYTMWSHAISRDSGAADTALNLAAAAANYASYGIHAPIALNRVSFLVTTAVTSGSVAGQVSFVRFPTYASTSGSVAIGTLTIPNAASVGQLYYKDLAYVKLNAGEQLMCRIARQAVDAGTAAGAGFLGFLFEPAPDAVANQTNMVVSA